MKRELLYKIICPSFMTANCGNQVDCDYCREHLNNWLDKYDKQIKAEVIEECNRKLDELERDYKSCYGVEIVEMYAEVYEDFRTWLKEQNK